MKPQWRAFTLPVSKLTASHGFEEALAAQLSFLQDELDKLLANEALVTELEPLASLHRGAYWNKATALAGKPHLTWELPGERAKYWRMVLERLRTVQLSQAQRKLVAEAWEEVAWDRERVAEVRESLRGQKCYPTQQTLWNVLRAQGDTPLPKTTPIQLDYTVGDRQVVRELAPLSWEVKLGDKWWQVTVPKPVYLRPTTEHYAKPVFQRNKQSELVCRIAYELAPEALGNADASGRLGVDLGKVKPFAAAMTWTDGSYGTELAPSRELSRLQAKQARQREQLRRLYAKRDAYEKLLSGREDQALRRKLLKLERELSAARGKATAVKEAMARLTARDVVAHAREADADTIALEDLRFTTGKSGKWDHSRVQGFIEDAAACAGVRVEKVNASNTSHTDPFSDETVAPNKKRKSKLASGSKLDRDYCAALELSRRQKKAKARKRKLFEGSCRDKFGPTPKRPKAPARRKHVLALKAKNTVVVSSPSVARASVGQGQGPTSRASEAKSLQTVTFTHEALLL